MPTTNIPIDCDTLDRFVNLATDNGRGSHTYSEILNWLMSEAKKAAKAPKGKYLELPQNWDKMTNDEKEGFWSRKLYIQCARGYSPDYKKNEQP